MILQSQLIGNIIANEVYHIGWESLDHLEEIETLLRTHLTFDIRVTKIEDGFLISYTLEESTIEVSFVFKKNGNQFTVEEKIN